MAVQPLTDEDMRGALLKARSRKEADAITALRLSLNRDRLTAAVKSFIDGTMVYMNLIDELEDTIRSVGLAPGLETLLVQATAIHRELQMGATRSAGDEVKSDPVTAPPEEKPAKPFPDDVTPIASQPETLTSKSFADLKDEYLQYFSGMEIRSDKAPRVLWYANKALKHKPRYERVADALAIPWWFIAGIHALESTFNTSAHLHNGDPLTARTKHVPKGRPEGGSPPFTWSESATDALRRQGLAHLSDWSLPRALYRWERYNGFGYRKRKVPTPYLWSYSSIYEKGKFTSDGRYSTKAISQQCGAAVLLRFLYDRKDVELDFDFANAPSGDSGTSAPQETFDEFGRFGQWWRQKLAHITFFKPHELLVKGASHAKNGLNTDPPEAVWENGLRLVSALEDVRRHLGRPVRLNSVYRSEAYNRAIGGARHSQHKLFKAADITVDGMTPRAVVDELMALRERGVFSGGIGLYRSFAHIDVRGHNVFWRG